MSTEKAATRIANVVIVLAIIVSGAWELYAIINYKIFFAVRTMLVFSPYDGVVLGYILPTLFLIFFIVALKQSESFKINLTLVLISTMVSLYVVEGVFHILSETKLDVVQRFRREGKRAFPAFNPSTFISYNLPVIEGRSVYPLSGISNVTTVLCNETGEWVFYESDEYGFHNPKSLYRPDKLSIAALGDSFAQGACVRSEKNAITLIRNMYQHTLNFGFAGKWTIIRVSDFQGICRTFTTQDRPMVVLS